MNLKDLEYFKIICQQKSITKAAHSLYLTPQGLSKIVKNIENELGTTLLNRTVSGITLTETGMCLYENLEELLGNYESICSEIRCIEQRQQHEIDLLSAYGILRLVTPECLEDFQKKYPHIKLNYREYPDKQVSWRFSQGEGNVAFMIGNAEQKYLNSEKMESFTIQLLVHEEHPLAKKEMVSILDLKEERLYIESGEFYIHDLIVEKCQAAGFEPNIVFETSGFSLCHKMVKKKKGISVTVDFIFDDMADENLRMIPFEDGPYFWDTYILSRKGSVENPDVELFCRHVKHWISEIQAGRIER